MFENEGMDTNSDELVKILLLLDELKETSGEDIFIEHIRQMLLSNKQNNQSRECLFHSILLRLIEGLEEKFESGSPLRTELKLLKIHLAPPVTAADVEVVQARLNKIHEDLRREEKVSNKSLLRIFEPILPKKGDSTVVLPATGAGGELTEGEEVIRSQNVEDNSDIARVRDDFSRHVNEAIAQNDQFGVLLDIELNALQDAAKLDDLESRREILIKEVEKFIDRHHQLSEKFDKASRYLQLMETDNQQLTDELDRVRLLSLTDELTGLPNRRAFMKRLEDEVGRVNRYGYPISLVLIDLDEFKSINDVYGHAGGDAVLRCYAEYVLSAFRHHDMVCRYGGEEFAVVLPNTSEEGSMRALEKARDFAAKTHCMHNGERLDMPTFSAGLAQYKHGELPTAFIERADSALYRAKRLGRNRIELADPEADNSEEYRTNQG